LRIGLNPASGRKIIKILEKNPEKDDKKYDEDDLPHMRKVVSYCKRHLAQEEKAKKDHSSKSYKSYVLSLRLPYCSWRRSNSCRLKNWGHDAGKTE